MSDIIKPIHDETQAPLPDQEAEVVTPIPHTGKFPPGHPFRENPPKKDDGSDRFAGTPLGEAMPLIKTPDYPGALGEPKGVNTPTAEQATLTQPVRREPIGAPEARKELPHKRSWLRRLMFGAGIAGAAAAGIVGTLAATSDKDQQVVADAPDQPGDNPTPTTEARPTTTEVDSTPSTPATESLAEALEVVETTGETPEEYLAQIDTNYNNAVNNNRPDLLDGVFSVPDSEHRQNALTLMEQIEEQRELSLDKTYAFKVRTEFVEMMSETDSQVVVVVDWYYTETHGNVEDDEIYNDRWQVTIAKIPTEDGKIQHLVELWVKLN